MCFCGIFIFFRAGTAWGVPVCLHPRRSGGSGVFLSRPDAGIGDGTGVVFPVFFPPCHQVRAERCGERDTSYGSAEPPAKGEEGLCIVTYPDALAEKVVSRKELGDKTLKLHAGEKVDMNFITEVLRSYGFEYVDYVYEPGQYAVRGSIIDVFSFSSEFPFRIDFFGDEVESIRTFEVETQLSKEKKENIVIVPDLSHSLEQGGSGGMVSFLEFLKPDTVLSMRDFLWLRERIQNVHDEALTPQAIAAREAEENGAITLEGKLIDGGEFTLRALDFRRMEFGNKPTGTPDATIAFNTTAQPISIRISTWWQLHSRSTRRMATPSISVVTVPSRQTVSRLSSRTGGITYSLPPWSVPCMRVLPTLHCAFASLPTISFLTVSINTT